MAILIIETLICASAERCFDLARDIGLHCETTSKTNEKVVAGVMSGLIERGQLVTFEAVHFGVRQRLTSKIVEFERPLYFADEMTKGPFTSMPHRHEFDESGESTFMKDIVCWKSPLGILGVLADVLFLKRHMTNFICERGVALKEVAESQVATNE